MSSENSVTLLFPHQLFKKSPAVFRDRPVYLVEEFLFFKQYLFHKNKILLHRASMKAYETSLTKKGNIVKYIDAENKLSEIRNLIVELSKQGVKEIHYCDPVDNWLGKRIKETAGKYGLVTIQYPTPNFLNAITEANEYFTKKKNYFQTDFYIDQRKKRNILLEKDGKPLGGKWTFDTENRKKLPKGEKIPSVSRPGKNHFVKEADEYVNTFYIKNYGTTEYFYYPVTHTEAEKWLDEFLEKRFDKFGIYEDAMAKSQDILFHSLSSPLLNIGLLDPQLVIDKTLEAAIEYKIPLNSLEGFIRQVIGWREFIRIVYEREGSFQRTKNYWGFTRKIPAGFWTGDTGIHPVDTVIKKLLKTGYTHHIERLMVLGNFMLLCEFDPDEVYRWFMEMYVDSYDWVMVPNVYGMTQFSDGGLMTTKPYISGSNYLMKMGDWDKGEWQKKWDGLFWRFMHVHRDFFVKNPRLGMLVKTFDKMPPARRNEHLKNADNFLRKLDE